MSELYPYLSDVTHEYAVATGKKSSLATLAFKEEAINRTRIRVKVTAYPYDAPMKMNPRMISSARGLKVVDADKHVFTSRKSYKVGVKWNEIFNEHFDRKFIFQGGGNLTQFPIDCHRFQFTAELPIILVFFHLSSVARYKPEFLYTIMESRMWPVISTARRHCLYKFLLLFWSHFHQTTYNIKQR